MRFLLGLLLVMPSTTAAQSILTVAFPVTVEVRSVDSARVVGVEIVFEGSLLANVGGVLLDSGSAAMRGGKRTANTPSILELRDSPGFVVLRGDRTGPELQVTVIAGDAQRRQLTARGHFVRVGRDHGGRFQLSAWSAEAKR